MKTSDLVVCYFRRWHDIVVVVLRTIIVLAAAVGHMANSQSIERPAGERPTLVKSLQYWQHWTSLPAWSREAR
jgi:hypothetical protein